MNYSNSQLRDGQNYRKKLKVQLDQDNPSQSRQKPQSKPSESPKEPPLLHTQQQLQQYKIENSITGVPWSLLAPQITPEQKSKIGRVLTRILPSPQPQLQTNNLQKQTQKQDTTIQKLQHNSFSLPTTDQIPISKQGIKRSKRKGKESKKLEAKSRERIKGRHQIEKTNERKKNGIFDKEKPEQKIQNRFYFNLKVTDMVNKKLKKISKSERIEKVKQIKERWAKRLDQKVPDSSAPESLPDLSSTPMKILSNVKSSSSPKLNSEIERKEEIGTALSTTTTTSNNIKKITKFGVGRCRSKIKSKPVEKRKRMPRFSRRQNATQSSGDESTATNISKSIGIRKSTRLRNFKRITLKDESSSDSDSDSGPCEKNGFGYKVNRKYCIEPEQLSEDESDTDTEQYIEDELFPVITINSYGKPESPSKNNLPLSSTEEIEEEITVISIHSPTHIPKVAMNNDTEENAILKFSSPIPTSPTPNLNLSMDNDEKVSSKCPGPTPPSPTISVSSDTDTDENVIFKFPSPIPTSPTPTLNLSRDNDEKVSIKSPSPPSPTPTLKLSRKRDTEENASIKSPAPALAPPSPTPTLKLSRNSDNKDMIIDCPSLSLVNFENINNGNEKIEESNKINLDISLSLKGLIFSLVQFGADDKSSNIITKSGIKYSIMGAGGLVNRIITIRENEKNHELMIISQLNESGSEYSADAAAVRNQIEIPLLTKTYSSYEFAYLTKYYKEMKRDLFSSTFVFDCLSNKKLVDLSEYRIGESLFQEYNASEVFLLSPNTYKGWDSLILKDILPTTNSSASNKTKPSVSKSRKNTSGLKKSIKDNGKNAKKATKTVVATKIFLCICGNEYEKARTLAAHKMRCFAAGAERNKICIVCNKGHFTNDDLKKHKSTHAEKIPCTKCKERFASLPSLQRHLNEHCGKKPRPKP